VPAPPGAAPATATPAPSASPAPATAAAAAPATATAPHVPEAFEPEKPVVLVSRRALSAPITVHRDGDTQRSASLVWWTTDGTAVADKDYVDLGARIEKFAPGEHARTIYVPIVHDTKRVGRKSFYVNLRAGQGDDRRDPGQRVEVTIDDGN
jgi:hypothetical protein